MLRTIVFVIALMASSGQVYAEALTEMTATLEQLAGKASITAQIQTQVTRQLGEGEEAHIREGEASVRVVANKSGLRLYYTPEILQTMSDEQQLRTQDADADTPVLTAIDELQPVALKHMLSAAENLLWLVESSQYQGWQEDRYEGRALRKLTFSFGLERLSEREKKYVKKYKSQVHVWIDEAGIPVASHHVSRLSGSAFIIIRFKSSTDEIRRYQRYDDRLLMNYRRQDSDSSGAGERSVHHIEHSLSIIGAD